MEGGLCIGCWYGYGGRGAAGEREGAKRRFLGNERLSKAFMYFFDDLDDVLIERFGSLQNLAGFWEPLRHYIGHSCKGCHIYQVLK